MPAINRVDLQLGQFGNAGKFGVMTSRSNFFFVDPVHHASQTEADLLDTMLAFATASRFEERCTCTILRNPLSGELTALNLVQNPLHLCFGFVGDDPRTADVVTILGRVADAVPHVAQAALVEQVDDQLQLVHALEVGHFRLIARFDQRIETRFDQFADAAAEDDLFAEQVGFGFFGEGGFDHAAARPADSFGIGQTDLLGRFGGTLAHRDQAGNTATFFVFAADQMAGPFGSDQQARRFPLGGSIWPK